MGRLPRNRLQHLLAIGTASVGMLAQAGPAFAHGGDASAFGGGSAGGREVSVDAKVQRAIGLRVVEARTIPVDETFSLTGDIEAIPQRSTLIGAPVSGRIVELFVHRGQRVARGQTVVRFDSPELRRLAVDADRATAQAQADLTEYQARLRLARSTYRRERDLVRAGISARRDQDEARASEVEAQANVDAARSRAALAGRDVRARLASLGQADSQSASSGAIIVTAPTSGVVTEQYANAGEAIEAGKPIVSVVDTSAVYATARVYEKDLGRVRVGQRVELETESYPGRFFNGRIALIDAQVDPQTRTVGVRAVLDNADGALKPQMFATFRIVSAPGANRAVAVPSSAVLSSGDGTAPQIFVRDEDGGFVLTDVLLGNAVGSNVIVRKGVVAGDHVVSERAFQLQAQLLKGGGDAEAAKPKEKSGSKSADAKPADAAPPGNRVPLWAWWLFTSAALVGTFVAGRAFGARAARRLGDR